MSAPGPGEGGGRAALLLIDLQRNMFEGEPAVAGGVDLLAAVSGLLARARAAHAPVLWVRNGGGPGEPDEPGSVGWQLTPAVPRLAAEPIVDKRQPDAFAETNLGALLRARGVRSVVVAGLQSEFCVAATCRGAHARGYAVTLVSDAHGTFDAPAGGPAARDVAAREAAALAAEGAVELVEADRVRFG